MISYISHWYDHTFAGFFGPGVAGTPSMRGRSSDFRPFVWLWLGFQAFFGSLHPFPECPKSTWGNKQEKRLRKSSERINILKERWCGLTPLGQNRTGSSPMSFGKEKLHNYCRLSTVLMWRLCMANVVFGRQTSGVLDVVGLCSADVMGNLCREGQRKSVQNWGFWR